MKAFIILVFCFLLFPFFACGVKLNAVEPSVDGPSVRLFRACDGDFLKLLECARLQNKAIVVAHRGGYAPGFPENAPATFKRAIASAPIVLECDVVSSSDGIDFLHHDLILNRTTTGDGQVNQHTWSTISQLRLKDNSGNITEHKPIRLDTFIESFVGKVFLMLDLKSPFSTADIVRKVKSRNSLKSVVFIAYNYDQAKEILSLAPEALVALGVRDAHSLSDILEVGLGKTPFVVLTDGLSIDLKEFAPLLSENTYILAKSYAGVNPADAKLPIEETISEFDSSSHRGIQLIVSNRPISAYNYLNRKNLYLSFLPCE